MKATLPDGVVIEGTPEEIVQALGARAVYRPNGLPHSSLRCTCVATYTLGSLLTVAISDPSAMARFVVGEDYFLAFTPYP